jgi:hypothetical protein
MLRIYESLKPVIGMARSTRPPASRCGYFRRGVSALVVAMKTAASNCGHSRASK